MVRPLASLLVLALSACASSGQMRTGETRTHTVLVVNQSPHDAIVYEDATGKVRLGRIGALSSGCVKLRGEGSGLVTLYVRRFASANWGLSSPPFDPWSSPGWRWTIAPSDRDYASNLQNAAPCGRLR